MGLTCTRCGNSGFLNNDQFPDEVANLSAEEKLKWLLDLRDERSNRGCSCHINPPCSFCETANDIEVCDCCGDGEGWYGTPGEHYNQEDPRGPQGPYASNGGLCQCH
jgi:hypothetical protein